MKRGTSAEEIPLQATDNATAIVRLTALWGLAESGLGGVMFALKIPFTGFFIGAVAVVLLSLIAKFSHGNYRQLIASTVTVLMVKAAVSPHSPLPAYFAVSFQGFIAALLFSRLPSHKLACILLGILSMVESALQKLIVLTLVFGKSIWEAANNLVKEIAGLFGLHSAHNYALWLIGGYVLLYAVWGLVVGLFSAKTPEAVQRRKAFVLENFKAFNKTENGTTHSRTRRLKKRKQWVAYAGVLALILFVFAFSGADGKRIGWILLRSLSAMLLLILVAQPLLKFLFRKWVSRRSEGEQKRATEVMEQLPVMRRFLPLAYQMVRNEKGLLDRLGAFVTVVIILALYAEPDAQHPSL